MTDRAAAKHLRINSFCLWRHLTTDKHKTFRWKNLTYKILLTDKYYCKIFLMCYHVVADIVNVQEISHPTNLP